MRLRRIVKDRWTVVAVCSDRGECQLLDFLYEAKAAGGRDVDRLLALFQMVAGQHGPQGLPVELSHQIDGPIYEFIRGRIRVLWFYDEDKVVVCSHGFLKTTQKTPKVEKQRASAAHAEYFAAKRGGRLVVD